MDSTDDNGRRRLQAAIDEEHEAKSVRGRAAVAAPWVHRAAGLVTDVRTVIGGGIALVAVVLALIARFWN